MSKKRRNHSAKFIAKVATDSLKGDKILSKLASQYEVHPNQITQWKQQLTQHAAELFMRGPSGSSVKNCEGTDLHAKIGQLTIENDFLATVLGR